MQKNKIKLYTLRTSPFAAKVEAFLDYKGLDYELIDIHPLRLKQDLPYGHTIPVLELDGEFRNESTQIGIWLDESFPETKSLIDIASKEKILKADAWVSENLIALLFYTVYPKFDGSFIKSCKHCLNLAKELNENTKLGFPSFFWPMFIKEAPFIKNIISKFKKQSFIEAKKMVFDELEQVLAKDTYIAGTKDVSLADLSAYAQFKLAQKLNLREFLDLETYPRIKTWFEQMS